MNFNFVASVCGKRILTLNRSCFSHCRATNTFVRVASLCSKAAEPDIPKNTLADLYSASHQAENGRIYDKKPFKLRLQKDKKYSWCLCGNSKSQPLCDGTHRNPYLKIKLRPVRFQVPEDKEYWLCNCKQTSNRPFCDGTHKREDIQASVK
ncbi:CDGSH iron-sulfur domain-containing protein 3, mitochondrial [Anabrus simplex]|uniref:CDGSH iron-sulfur domain-containing protein 3, mitochondrial n=1 Tax=Anabrus simplex TaxID=316456 RepID=UPI0034DD3AAF